MWIVRHTKWWFVTSIILLVAACIAIFGLKTPWGVDFTGGTLIEVVTPENAPELLPILEASGLEQITLRSGEGTQIVRAGFIENSQKEALSAELTKQGFTVTRMTTIGSLLGNEARAKALASVGVVLLGIVLFVTFAFRKVSEPVSSWKYGIIAIIALLHDVIIPTGAFIALSYFFGGFEIDTLFITGLLVILGFSVHDTIVVFDRIREKLRRNTETGKHENFKSVVGNALNETIARSINTSLTTVIALIALYFFGPETTKNFSLALIIGILTGTYSSIFIASPLLILAANRKALK